jgi:hypothetical protein
MLLPPDSRGCPIVIDDRATASTADSDGSVPAGWGYDGASAVTLMYLVIPVLDGLYVYLLWDRRRELRQGVKASKYFPNWSPS